jgi:hypothetical protein
MRDPVLSVPMLNETIVILETTFFTPIMISRDDQNSSLIAVSEQRISEALEEKRCLFVGRCRIGSSVFDIASNGNEVKPPCRFRFSNEPVDDRVSSLCNSSAIAYAKIR